MMIIILTMLVLTLMKAVFLNIKVDNQVVIKHEALYQLEAVAHKLINAPIDPNCLVIIDDPNQALDLLLHHGGCSLIDHNRQYYYVVDDLGLYPCLQIISGKKIDSSHHWLINVATAPPRQEILQLRIAKPVQAMACDFFEARQIHQRVISWRYLPFANKIRML